MTAKTMTLDEFSERHIKPAMERLLKMAPHELIECAAKHPISSDLCEMILAMKYGIVRGSE